MGAPAFPAKQLTRKQVWAQSWPLIFANGVIPLVGVVDTGVISLTGTASDLAGVALGAAVFSVAYWGTYALRQSTTGLTAQAEGRGSRRESQMVLIRSLILGLVLGTLFLILRAPITNAAIHLLQGTTNAEGVGRLYLEYRFFGTPAALGLFAVTGWMIGMGLTRLALLVQGLMAAINALLDVWFVMGLHMGASGVALGTVLAEWTALMAGILLIIRHIHAHEGFSRHLLRALFLDGGLTDGTAIRKLLFVNVDATVRSMCMVAGFAWFVNSGAKQGDAILAGNQILLQFITVWAFVLDAFAHTAEAETGRAVGASSVPRLRRGIRLTSEFALGFAVLFALVTLLAGPGVLTWLVESTSARNAAIDYLPWSAAVPLLGVAAWQLDGVFVGATRGPTMRNSALAALFIYLVIDHFLAPAHGNAGVWSAFLMYYVARWATMLVGYPSLERAVAEGRA